MEGTKKKLYVERDGFWTEAAMVFLALAMIFILIGSIGRWDDSRFLSTRVALPIFCGLLLVLCLLLFGKRAFWTTVVPVAMGVVFFVFRAMNMENEWLRGCWIIVYLVIMVLYAMVFSYPKLKWALALVLLAVFAYHIGVQDLPRLMDLENPVSFVDGMEEMSVLGIILAMLFLSFAMKSGPKPVKGKPEPEPEQPAAGEEKGDEPAPAPAEEPAPAAAAEEKKLSRREKRKLEKQRKLEEKRPEPQPVVLPEPEQEAQLEPEGEPQLEPEGEPQPEPQSETESELAETVQHKGFAPAAWDAEEPAQVREPASETEPAAVPTTEEIPVEELGTQAAAAAAYPLEETQPSEEKEAATEDP